MATYRLAPIPKIFLAGTQNYKIYTYASGGLTPINTWSDNGSTLNANPVVLDVNGTATIYILVGTSYRFIYKTSADVTIYDIDPIVVEATSVENLTVTDTLTAEQATQWLCFDVMGETETLTTGNAKRTFRLAACTVTEIPRASLTTASSGGTPTFDVNMTGTSILGAAKLTIDANEKTSTTAATPTTLTTSTITEDAEITIDCDVAGTNAVGAKLYLHVRWTT